MFTCVFTRNLNLTTLRRSRLERLFVNSDPRCTFFAKEHISNCSFKRLRFIYMFGQSDSLKWSGIWKENALNGYHYMDFWSTFDKLWLLNEHRTISNNCIIRNNHKKFEKKSNIKCYFQGITSISTINKY